MLPITPFPSAGISLAVSHRDHHWECTNQGGQRRGSASDVEQCAKANDATNGDAYDLFGGLCERLAGEAA